MNHWRTHGAICEAGDIGGDIQVGGAVEKRYVNSAYPGRLVIVAICPIAGDGTDAMASLESDTSLQVQIEYMICRDVDAPGDTEEWSDYRYMTIPLPPGTNIRQAEALCTPFLELYNGTNIVWNGERL